MVHGVESQRSDDGVQAITVNKTLLTSWGSSGRFFGNLELELAVTDG
jgi:hypothetical protein